VPYEALVNAALAAGFAKVAVLSLTARCIEPGGYGRSVLAVLCRRQCFGRPGPEHLRSALADDCGLSDDAPQALS